MNRSPLRDVTEDDIDTYKRDGVVCLRNVFDREWAEMLRPVAKEAKLNPSKFGLLPSLNQARFMARTIPEFRKFSFESPLGEATGKVLQSKTVRFFFDELFSKEPNSKSETIWHNDRAGWPVTGQMVPSLWVPLTRITKANSLECIAGSQRHDKLYWLFSTNAQQMVRPASRPTQPDVQRLRGEPDIQFLTWDMEPGDMLIIHPWTLHYNSGNPLDDWRFAISTRVLGEDIRWDPRPDCLNIAGISLDEMIAGEEPDGPLFPMLWSADGRRDSGEDYPRGFSSKWQPEAYERARQRIAAKGGIKVMRDAEGGPSTEYLDELKAVLRRAE